MSKYIPAVFQPTVRPAWAGILSYVSSEEKAQILEAIIRYPNQTEIQSRFWEETIKPDLEAQYKKFVQSCKAKGLGSKTYWDEIKSEIDDMDNISLPYDNDMNNKSITSDKVLKGKSKDKDKGKSKDKGDCKGEKQPKNNPEHNPEHNLENNQPRTQNPELITQNLEPNIHISSRCSEDDILSWWNDLAKKYALAEIRIMTDERRAKVLERSKMAGGVEGFKRLIEQALEKSEFLRGGNRNGWKADFDFFLQKKSFIRAAEGSYSAGLAPPHKKTSDEIFRENMNYFYKHFDAEGRYVE